MRLNAATQPRRDTMTSTRMQLYTNDWRFIQAPFEEKKRKLPSSLQEFLVRSVAAPRIQYLQWSYSGPYLPGTEYKIEMLYFHNTSQEIQKLATYAAKSF